MEAAEFDAALKAAIFDGVLANIAESMEVHDGEGHLSGNIHRRLSGGEYRSNDAGDALYLANVVIRARNTYRAILAGKTGWPYDELRKQALNPTPSASDTNSPTSQPIGDRT